MACDRMWETLTPELGMLYVLSNYCLSLLYYNLVRGWDEL